MKRKISFLVALVAIINITSCTFVKNKTDNQLKTTVKQSELANSRPKIVDDQSESVNEQSKIDEDGKYYSVEDVALYIHTYGKLPKNYITKDEADKLGWIGGSLEEYAEGCVIGGDVFGSGYGFLPEAEGRVYYECDIIDPNESDGRGPKRILYSNDGLIYYTEDHYESFKLLYGEE